ncbi:hypothetical protein SERLA73DRAFT_148700 [Serpula lacrymans var. lacrymans S7.3]|uniref:Uncharacterized protein n=1 Tax=Serpula lacrymans var. lacrymans (strain S7.3) TaxID=936435 RepID=F8QKJ5_SERL3|nr:hypothetical protein SERLA73DRAFT_148700 [Serpula lacrymans var. lacrymans S7.3]
MLSVIWSDWEDYHSHQNHRSIRSSYDGPAVPIQYSKRAYSPSDLGQGMEKNGLKVKYGEFMMYPMAVENLNPDNYPDPLE